MLQSRRMPRHGTGPKSIFQTGHKLVCSCCKGISEFRNGFKIHRKRCDRIQGREEVPGTPTAIGISNPHSLQKSPLAVFAGAHCAAKGQSSPRLTPSRGARNCLQLQRRLRIENSNPELRGFPVRGDLHVLRLQRLNYADSGGLKFPSF